jgi:L-rhamnose mutarotase
VESGVIIKTFRMRVHPEHAAEYERRHNPIWPELEATLRAHGVARYFIFLDDTTADLFAYAEIDSDDQWAAIAATEVCQRWWQSMKTLMPSNPDGSPESRSLRAVFRLDRTATGDTSAP